MAYLQDPPAEIIEAAEKVRVWMEQNGYRNWQLGGVCDRRFTQQPNEKEQRREPAADDVRFVSERNDWLAFAAPAGSEDVLAKDLYSLLHIARRMVYVPQTEVYNRKELCKAVARLDEKYNSGGTK